MKRACSIGAAVDKPCSSPPFSRRKTLSGRDVHLLERRTNCSVKLVCGDHFKEFITDYERKQKYCSNPLKLHGALQSSTLKRVSADLHDKCGDVLPAVVEGRKLCLTCRVAVFEKLRRETNKRLSAALPNDEDKHADAPDCSDTVPASPSAPGFVATKFPEDVHPAPTAAAPDTTSTAEAALDSASTSAAAWDSASTTAVASDSGSSEVSSGSRCSPREALRARANEGLQMLGGSPLRVKEYNRSEKYRKEKQTRTANLLKTALAKAAGQAEEKNTDVSGVEAAGAEMLAQLKKAFDSAKTNAEKLKILAVLPASWSNAKIHLELGASFHVIKTVRRLVQEQGILCTPNQKRGKTLSSQTEKMVTLFYQLPHISREMAGKKECISVVEDGVRGLKQKRLVLGDLREIYGRFKEENPDLKIGLSKFAALRPRNCVLAGAAGTHAVCVCTVHQNFKLMFMGGNIGSLKINEENVFEHYKECFLATMCKNPSEKCYFGKCELCPGTNSVEESLKNLFRHNFVEKITYKRWQKEDNGRYAMHTISSSMDDFVETFVQAIPELRQHDYTAKQQAQNFENVKKSLQVGEVLVVADFSENFSFVIQDSIQGVYWNNNQATVHPFACYTRNPDTMEVEPLNLVVISDHLQHVTATVSAFQDALIEFLKIAVPQLKKIYYFSDGCSGQYKNRFNMKNLLMHEQDYGIPAEWHFFATSHGKGPSDGLGGTLKRMATKASLQRPTRTRSRLLMTCTDGQLHVLRA